MKITKYPLILALAIAVPAAFAADDVYRSVMPDGSVRYGEKPEPGARSVKRIPPPPASTGTVIATPEQINRPETSSERGGATVIPMPQRESPQAAEQGRTQAPPGALPKRGY